MFSDTCKIDTKFLSLNYLGSYVEPQPSKGCVLSGPDKDREVHIIELQAPNSSRWASEAKKTCHRILCWGQDAHVDLGKVCLGWKQRGGECELQGGAFLALLGIFFFFLINIFQSTLSKSSFARQSSHSLSWVIIQFTQNATNLGNPCTGAVLYLSLFLLEWSGCLGIHPAL